MTTTTSPCGERALDPRHHAAAALRLARTNHVGWEALNTAANDLARHVADCTVDGKSQGVIDVYAAAYTLVRAGYRKALEMAVARAADRVAGVAA